MLRDRSSKMSQLWGPQGWSKRSTGAPMCGFSWDGALSGRGCNSNWYFGILARTPTYPRPDEPAPALLGFDETIYGYCSSKNHQSETPFNQDNAGLAHRCVQAQQNVLRHMGGWNMCVNLQWQTCALQGRLPGQRSKVLQFSIAPRALDVGIFDHPAGCVGGCANGYAISDVYFAEICVYSHVCRNRDRLFALDYGDPFECDFDESAFKQLQGWLA